MIICQQFILYTMMIRILVHLLNPLKLFYMVSFSKKSGNSWTGLEKWDMER